MISIKTVGATVVVALTLVAACIGDTPSATEAHLAKSLPPLPAEMMLLSCSDTQCRALVKLRMHSGAFMSATEVIVGHTQGYAGFLYEHLGERIGEAKIRFGREGNMDVMVKRPPLRITAADVFDEVPLDELTSHLRETYAKVIARAQEIQAMHAAQEEVRHKQFR